MAEYHVGCGAFGIYVGTLNKNKDKWVNKSDVTDEAFTAVAQFCVEHNMSMAFNYHGKRYELAVSEIDDGERKDGDSDG